MHSAGCLYHDALQHKQAGVVAETETLLKQEEQPQEHETDDAILVVEQAQTSTGAGWPAVKPPKKSKKKHRKAAKPSTEHSVSAPAGTSGNNATEDLDAILKDLGLEPVCQCCTWAR